MDGQDYSDKVLTGLKCCKQFIYECDRCPYYDMKGPRDTICVETLHQDAILVIEALKGGQAQQ